jgi:PAS domain S-box-containing protein
MRIGRAAFALGCWILAASWCPAQAPAEPREKVTLQLKWHHQFQFAGYYAALEKGYYREAGLEVDIREGELGCDTVQEVVSGRAQFGVGNCSLLLSRQKGQPVVVLAAIFQHSPLILLARPEAGIHSVHDLVGKRVMIEDNAEELNAYLRKEGVSLDSLIRLPHTFDPQDLLRGNVDCISAFVDDEPYYLEEAHKPFLALSPLMGGIDFYGDNLFTSEAELKHHPAQARAFREASLKGWKYAMQHPEEMADMILARYGGHRNRDFLLYEARKMMPLVQPNLVDMGYMYSGRWQHVVDTYEELGLLPTSFRLDGFLYDPQARAQQDYQRLMKLLVAVLVMGGCLGGAALVFLRLNLRLKGEIASRHKAEWAIRLEHEQAERYLAIAEVILVAFDTQGRVTLLNRKGYSVLGYESGELLGRDWFQVCVPPEDRRAAFQDYQRIVAGTLEQVDLDEYFIMRKDGERRLIAWHNSILYTHAGMTVGMLCSGEDITERKRAERDKAGLQAQLAQAQKMESLGSLAGGVAHDMNNVLGAILGMASALIESQPKGSPSERAFGTIIKAAERGGKMVRSLLSFARQSPAQEQVVDLNGILREEVQLLERTTLAKVNLVMTLEHDLWPILGDAAALNNAFMNLCLNAVDAMAPNGTLTVRTCNGEGGWVEVQVEDDGAGMSKEVLARALDPFFTTKPQGKGTGLGLSMVYSTVKAHQGRMEIQSEPGLGTCVTLRFPACPVPASSGDLTGAVRPDTAQAILEILVVDDDELIRTCLQEILDILGHTAAIASSGEEALLMLEGGYRPDMVIMDLNMPGLGGGGTLPRLRALYPQLPVLLATGRTDQSALDLVDAHAHVTLLSKPFTMRELEQALRLTR